MKSIFMFVCASALLLCASAFGQYRTVARYPDSQPLYYVNINTQLLNGVASVDVDMRGSSSNIPPVSSPIDQPWRISSLQVYVAPAGATTVTVSRIRSIVENLYGSVVTTNQFNEVETNSNHSITGTSTRLVCTNVLLSVVKTNEIVQQYTGTELKDMYFVGGDTLRIAVQPTDTSSRWVLIDGTR